MAGRLGLTLAEYRTLEAGELHITFDLSSGSSTCAGGALSGACEGSAAWGSVGRAEPPLDLGK